MAPKVTEEQVLGALRTVIDPDLGKDIVTLGMIKDMRIKGADVAFTFELTTPACPIKDQFKEVAADAIRRLVPGVGAVEVTMTAQVPVGQQGGETLIPGVRNTVAVASGKGGVGKSTVALNLAVALSQLGARVGLLDLDIYGPSLPTLAGVNEHPVWGDNNKILPLDAHGMKVMSLGFLLGDDDRPVIWRGPMVHKAVSQMLGDVEWGELDYLVLDLPPGTGDAQLTLAQLIPLSGVVIVMTAQDLTRTIAAKALKMFQKLEAPILGIVENMSTFICPSCGAEHEIFGVRGGGRAAAEQLGVPFLGTLPLDPEIVKSSDAGVPYVTAHPDRPAAQAFREVAGLVAARISVQTLRGADAPAVQQTRDELRKAIHDAQAEAAAKV